MPVPQLMHAEAEMDPVLGLYLPATQLVHVAWPPVSAYLPATQATQSADEMDPVLGFAVPMKQLVHVA